MEVLAQEGQLGLLGQPASLGSLVKMETEETQGSEETQEYRVKMGRQGHGESPERMGSLGPMDVLGVKAHLV